MTARPSRALRHSVLLAAFALVGCSSTSAGVRDPALAEEARERQRLAEETHRKLNSPDRLITDLDKALDKYLQYRLATGSVQSDTIAKKLESYLEQTANEQFELMVRQVDQDALPRNRAIAAATLGFSRRPEALDPLLNAAQSNDKDVVANAIFALGILADPRTPPAFLASVMESPAHDAMTRGGAAWSLHEIQLKLIDPAPCMVIWSRILGSGLEEFPPEVLVSALRSIGLSRDKIHRATVERFVSHPAPLVRASAAIALGRFTDVAAVPALMALIGPAEQNQNVRLAARKALQALAGGVDHGYDLEEWKRAFDRGV